MQHLNSSFGFIASSSATYQDVEAFTLTLVSEMLGIGFERQGELGLSFTSSFPVSDSAFAKYGQVLAVATSCVSQYPNLFTVVDDDKCHLDVGFDFPTCQW